VKANLYTLFRDRFPADRTNTFIETPDGTQYCYADLEFESARLANFFTQLGLKPGDRVAAQLDKSPNNLFLYLACVRAGFIYLPLNPAYRAAELEHYLDDAKPSAIVCRPTELSLLLELTRARGIAHLFTMAANGQGTLDEASQSTSGEHTVCDVRADDTAVLLYTSGTTGRPKGAMLSHANLASNALALHQAWGWKPDDVLLHALPLFHIHGLFVACHCVLLNGSKMILLPKFDVASIKEQLPHATVFMGVPTFYTRLLADPEFGHGHCRSVRLFTCGSAPLLATTFDEYHERTGHEILERYGMTETGMNTSNPLEGPRRPGTVGKPLPGVSIRIASETTDDQPEGKVGELHVKGPNIFSGYWRQPEKTAEEFTEDGYFKTGDLATRDADGYISIVGRAKDLVITGGLNVFPKEIESFLNELEGVVESAVIGLPHPDFGEAVTAVIVREPEHSELTEEKIIQTLKKRIADFKVPKRVYFVEELPRNTMGKVQKNILRQQYSSSK